MHKDSAQDLLRKSDQAMNRDEDGNISHKYVRLPMCMA